MSVHEYPEPLVLAVDLDLQDGQTEGRTEGGREGGKEKQRRGGEQMRRQRCNKLPGRECLHIKSAVTLVQIKL